MAKPTLKSKTPEKVLANQNRKKPRANDFNPRWKWSPVTAVIFVVVILFLSQYLIAYLLLIYPLLHGWNHAETLNWLTNSISAQFVFVLLAEGFTIGALVLFLKRYKLSLRDLGWNRAPKASDFGLALLVFIGYFVALVVVMSLATHLVPSLNVNQKQQLGFTGAASPVQLALTYISLAILPPFVEETVFRGFLYGSLRKWMNAISAALGTSLLFAIAHLELGTGAPPLWTAALDVFILSLGLVLLRVKTGSLWASVITHCLKNTVAFLALFIFTVNI